MAMTKKDLIAALEAFPDDTVIVLSGDGEGNDFSPLSSLEEGTYYPVTTWRGEFHPQDAEDEEDDEDHPEGTPTNAVCLWPVN